MLTVSESLKSHQQLAEAGSDIYLFELAKNTPSCRQYSRLCRYCARAFCLRQLLNSSSDIADMAFHPEGRNSTGINRFSGTKKYLPLLNMVAEGSGPGQLADLFGNSLDRIDLLYHSDDQLRVWPPALTI